MKETNKMIRKLNIILSILVVTMLTAFAQSPDILWNKNFGGDNWDYGNSVLQTEDGGFLIVGIKGFIPGQSSTGNVWLIRTDSNGDTLWTKTYGGTSGRDEGYSIQPVSNGGYIIAGQTTSFGAGNSDAYLIRINDDGDTLWTKTYGGESEDYVSRIQQTSDNGFIMVGRTYSYGLGSSDVWLIRTDENGDTLWTTTYGTAAIDFGNAVHETSDGGFVITGRAMDFAIGSPALYLVRADSDGDTLWTKIYNHPNAPVIFSIGKDVYEMPDGGFLVAGSRALLIRTDANGDTLWTKLYEGECNNMQPVNDGGFIIAGNNSLIRINQDADTVWTKIIGESSDVANSVQQTSDGGFIVTGRTNSSGNPNVWLVRIGSEGTTFAEYNSTVPSGYKLFQNYPNPFNPGTVISYQLPVSANVSLKVYDVLGNETATLADEYKTAGNYEVEFDATNLPSGIYFYKLQAGDFTETKKLTLLK